MHNFGLKLLHLFGPEFAHYMAITALKFNRSKKFYFESTRLRTNIAGLSLSHPLGLAAGFDKNGEVIQAAFNYGASFTEIGAITPLPQKGNTKPRMFRLKQDLGLINRLGFNNDGVDSIISRLEAKRDVGTLGINIGANRCSINKIDDYILVLEKCAGFVDFATINISSPNTPGLRDLQGSTALNELLSAVTEKNLSLPKPIKIFLKIDPDLEFNKLEELINMSLAFKLDALIATNTTISRDSIKSKYKKEIGGLSGKPLFRLSTKKLAQIFHLSSGKIPLIGVGGICNANDAYCKIKAGASAVQIYTAVGYYGLNLIGDIVRKLDSLLEKDGFQNVQSAVGCESNQWVK